MLQPVLDKREILLKVLLFESWEIQHSAPDILVSLISTAVKGWSSPKHIPIYPEIRTTMGGQEFQKFGSTELQKRFRVRGT